MESKILRELELYFDYDAAQVATPEDARQRLRVIKHYVRAMFGDKDINMNVKNFLNLFGIEPEIPSSVVGGFVYILNILKNLHKCKGRKCVLKLKEKTIAQELKIASNTKVPKRSASKKSVPKRSASKKSVPKSTAPKRNVPKRTASKRNVPNRTASKRKVTPKRTASKRNVPKKTASKRNVPKKTAPKKNVSKGNVRKEKVNESSPNLFSPDYLIHYT